MILNGTGWLRGIHQISKERPPREYPDHLPDGSSDTSETSGKEHHQSPGGPPGVRSQIYHAVGIHHCVGFAVYTRCRVVLKTTLHFPAKVDFTLSFQNLPQISMGNTSNFSQPNPKPIPINACPVVAIGFDPRCLAIEQKHHIVGLSLSPSTLDSFL